MQRIPYSCVYRHGHVFLSLLTMYCLLVLAFIWGVLGDEISENPTTTKPAPMDIEEESPQLRSSFQSQPFMYQFPAYQQPFPIFQFQPSQVPPPLQQRSASPVTSYVPPPSALRLVPLPALPPQEPLYNFYSPPFAPPIWYYPFVLPPSPNPKLAPLLINSTSLPLRPLPPMVSNSRRVPPSLLAVPVLLKPSPAPSLLDAIKSYQNVSLAITPPILPAPVAETSLPSIVSDSLTTPSDLAVLPTIISLYPSTTSRSMQRRVDIPVLCGTMRLCVFYPYPLPPSTTSTTTTLTPTPTTESTTTTTTTTTEQPTTTTTQSTTTTTEPTTTTTQSTTTQTTTTEPTTTTAASTTTTAEPITTTIEPSTTTTTPCSTTTETTSTLSTTTWSPSPYLMICGTMRLCEPFPPPPPTLTTETPPFPTPIPRRVLCSTKRKRCTRAYDEWGFVL